MTDTIFENTSTEQTNEQQSAVDNQSKYASWTVEDLVKKAEHADKHINTLETEMGDYRKNYDETLKQVLQKLDQVGNTSTNTDPSMNTNQYPEKSNSSGVSQTDIEKLVSMSFDRKQKETLVKSNVEKVRSELTKVWGENYSSKLKARMQELDVEQSYLESMAENYPQLFIDTVVGKQTSTSNPNTHVSPASSINVSSSPTMGNLRTHKDFRTLEKENPNLQHNAEFQQRKLQAAAQYGEDFYK